MSEACLPYNFGRRAISKLLPLNNLWIASSHQGEIRNDINKLCNRLKRGIDNPLKNSQVNQNKVVEVKKPLYICPIISQPR